MLSTDERPDRDSDAPNPRLNYSASSLVVPTSRPSASGEALCVDWLTRTVRAYVKAGAPAKEGSCHLFRHSVASLMLEGGADVRNVAELLGSEKLESTKNLHPGARRTGSGGGGPG